MVQIISKILEIREKIKHLKAEKKIVGFVPTMGALHIGHASLIKKAKEQCDIVIVSIFVNPTQFGPNEDFKNYPRQFEEDAKICTDLGVDCIFAPDKEEIYPEGEEVLTKVVPPSFFQDKLCGKTRSGHFNGVATIVLKLFNIITPDKAYFGIKDAQQLLIIKKMIRDLNVPVEIIDCPIIRDQDGLACSSRNKYLTAEARQKALSLYKTLKKVKQLNESGAESFKDIQRQAQELLHPDVKIEYIEAIDQKTFKEVKKIEKNTLIALAAKVDGVRLIDNIII